MTLRAFDPVWGSCCSGDSCPSSPGDKEKGEMWVVRVTRAHPSQGVRK
jgi:hypothetical protein